MAQDEASLATFINAMKAGYAELVPAPELRLLFVLLPEKSVAPYALIKRVADQLCGIPYNLPRLSQGEYQPVEACEAVPLLGT